MKLYSSFLVLALASVVSSQVLNRRFDEHSVKHSWEAPPKNWVLHSIPSPDHEFDLKFGLKQGKFSELISHLNEISDPFHNRYGNHLSKEQVDALVAPAGETVEALRDWLNFHGINPASLKHHTTAGEWVSVRVTVAQAEKMLGATYGLYHHAKSNDFILRTLSYGLPKSLLPHIDLVTPTTYFSTTKSMRSTVMAEPNGRILKVDDFAPVGIDAAVPASCNSAITPACLMGLYNTAGYKPKATDKNKLAIAGYLDEFANHADLNTFSSKFLNNTKVSFTTQTVNNGGDDQSKPGVEANLDIQYTVGLSQPTPNIYYSTGGSPPFNPDSQTPTNTNEPYLDFLNFFTAQSTIPQILTTSYGDDEQTVPNDYAVKVCDLFAQLGSRGTTVFFSSGDFGVGGGDCKTNDGTNKVLFQPAFPASCPFVTTVGGTTGTAPEKAVDFSGGGFSRYFPAPDYQKTVVNAYVSSLGNTNNGLYNKSGRAYPDIAAQGTGFQVVIGGRTQSVGGTSASSPTVAAIFSLLNDVRLSAGKSSLGFINPLLYSNLTSGLNDITSGNNPGCNTNGFSAAKGWDPVTGLGTPDFSKLSKLV